VVAATQVHHLHRLRAGGSHDPANLVPLCAACHSRVTLAEDVRREGWQGA
jgi:5-methylcytosine-specific restriction endonuclease McrA